jgi:hypothetical protein
MNEEKDQRQRLEHLYELRRDLLNEMEEADRELSHVRMQVERAESDMRIGDPGPPEYETLKGHTFPQTESRVVEAYRSLLKLEEKINATKEKLSG